MSLLPELDTPPSTGVFVDHEDFFATATDEEIEAGNFLGEIIDIEADHDNGMADL